MGIAGLIPFLKNASREVSLRNFSGSTVAIDAYCWLHKGAYSCSDKIVRGEPTDGYVVYCVKRLNMILSNGVKPIMVFDGQCLPAKSITEVKRREQRESARKKAKLLLREGKIKEARDFFQRCIDITPEMAHEVFIACTEMGIDCIVAPYEADAQLAYLCKEGIAHIVISEDSDLMLFGCERVLYKMDNNGTGLLIEKSKLNLCLGQKSSNFTFEKFRFMCVLSGCDYLPSLPGIGLKKACKFFSLITNPDIRSALSKLPIYLKLPNLPLTADYIEDFINANNTFLYQLVFCPKNRKLVPLNPYPSNLDPECLIFAGKYLSNDVACQLASGNLNCKNLQPFAQQVQRSKQKDGSIWNKNFQCKEFKIRNCDIMESLKSTEGKVISVDSSKLLRIGNLNEHLTCKTEEKIKELCDDEILKCFDNDRSLPVKRKSYEMNYEDEIITDTVNSAQNRILSSINNNETKRFSPVKRIVKSRFFRKDIKNNIPAKELFLEQKDECEKSFNLRALNNHQLQEKCNASESPVSCLDAIEKEYENAFDIKTTPCKTSLQSLHLLSPASIKDVENSPCKEESNMNEVEVIQSEPLKPDFKSVQLSSIKEKLGSFSWSKFGSFNAGSASHITVSMAARQSFKPLSTRKDNSSLQLEVDPNQSCEDVKNSVEVSHNNNDVKQFKQTSAFTKLTPLNKFGGRSSQKKQFSKNLDSRQPTIRDSLKRFVYQKK